MGYYNYIHMAVKNKSRKKIKVEQKMFTKREKKKTRKG
jgi:hypothetical protein